MQPHYQCGPAQLNLRYRREFAHIPVKSKINLFIPVSGNALTLNGVKSKYLNCTCAASRTCSGPVNFLPSRTMFASQYVRRYRFKMRHMVVSATSSNAKPGTLHTAMPSSPAALMSMLSVPLPMRTMIRSNLNFSKSSFVKTIVCHMSAPVASFNTCVGK